MVCDTDIAVRSLRYSALKCPMRSITASATCTTHMFAVDVVAHGVSCVARLIRHGMSPRCAQRWIVPLTTVSRAPFT